MFDRLLFTSLPALFSLTLFFSAGLLFLVELMIAKLILPLFGGTPAVWNTCMMFFQVMLLAGYGYAHLSGTKAGVNRQIILHLAILIAACIVLPISIPRQWGPSVEGSPIGVHTPTAPGFRRTPFFGPFIYRAFAPTVVCPNRPSVGRRSLFPLQRQQPRQHAGPDRLSDLD